MEKENKSQNILLNNTQNINNISNNNQNIIISTNGITSEQTKMIEYFVMFQKFMNFSPEMNKQNVINKDDQINNIDNINNKETTNIDKNEKNELIDNKEKGRRWNPIKRKKSKTYENNIIKEDNKIINQEINTNYGERRKNKINNSLNNISLIYY